MEAVRAFNNELSSLYESKPPISRAKMAHVTKSAIKAIKFYKHVVQSVEKFVTKCRPDFKVPGLYVIDSIVRQSRHQFGQEKDVFAPRFGKNIVQTFQQLLKCPPESRSKLIRVLNLWQKNNVFTPEVIQPLLDLCADPNNADLYIQAQEAVQSATGLAPTAPRPAKTETPKLPSEPAPHQPENNSAAVQNDVMETVSQLLQQSQGPQQQLSLSAQQQQLQQLQLLQQQLLQQSQMLQEPQQMPQQPLIDSNVLSQIQALTNQLLHRSKDDGKPPEPAFNKKLLDFDYGESDEEDDRKESHPSPKTSLPGNVQTILNDPGLMRQIHQMSETLQKTEELKNELNMQEAQQQQQQQQQHMMEPPHEFQHHQPPPHHIHPHHPPLPPGPMPQRQIPEMVNFPGVPPEMQMPQMPQMPQVMEDDDVQIIEEAHEYREDYRRERGRGRSRSTSRSRTPKRRRRSRSRERRRKRSRSRSRHKRSRSRERERERERRDRERERRKKGLPPIKEGHLSLCSTTLWIGHLNKNVSEELLHEELSNYGEVTSILMIPPRGCAYACFSQRREACRAVDRLRGTKLLGSLLKSAWAPGRVVQDMDFREYWDVDLGVTYIPFDKLPDNLDALSEGSIIDESTLPEHLKKSNTGDQAEDGSGAQASEQLRQQEQPQLPPQHPQAHPPQLPQLPQLPPPQASQAPGNRPPEMPGMPQMVTPPMMPPGMIPLMPVGMVPPPVMMPGMPPMGVPPPMPGMLPPGMPPHMTLPHGVPPPVPPPASLPPGIHSLVSGVSVLSSHTPTHSIGASLAQGGPKLITSTGRELPMKMSSAPQVPPLMSVPSASSNTARSQLAQAIQNIVSNSASVSEASRPTPGVMRPLAPSSQADGFMGIQPGFNPSLPPPGFSGPPPNLNNPRPMSRNEPDEQGERKERSNFTDWPPKTPTQPDKVGNVRHDIPDFRDPRNTLGHVDRSREGRRSFGETKKSEEIDMFSDKNFPPRANPAEKMEDRDMEIDHGNPMSGGGPSGPGLGPRMAGVMGSPGMRMQTPGSQMRGPGPQMGRGGPPAGAGPGVRGPSPKPLMMGSPGEVNQIDGPRNQEVMMRPGGPPNMGSPGLAGGPGMPGMRLQASPGGPAGMQPVHMGRGIGMGGPNMMPRFPRGQLGPGGIRMQGGMEPGLMQPRFAVRGGQGPGMGGFVLRGPPGVAIHSPGFRGPAMNLNFPLRIGFTSSPFGVGGQNVAPMGRFGPPEQVRLEFSRGGGEQEHFGRDRNWDDLPRREREEDDFPPRRNRDQNDDFPPRRDREQGDDFPPRRDRDQGDDFPPRRDRGDRDVHPRRRDRDRDDHPPRRDRDQRDDHPRRDRDPRDNHTPRRDRDDRPPRRDREAPREVPREVPREAPREAPRDDHRPPRRERDPNRPRGRRWNNADEEKAEIPNLPPTNETQNNATSNEKPDVAPPEVAPPAVAPPAEAPPADNPENTNKNPQISLPSEKAEITPSETKQIAPPSEEPKITANGETKTDTAEETSVTNNHVSVKESSEPQTKVEKGPVPETKDVPVKSVEQDASSECTEQK